MPRSTPPYRNGYGSRSRSPAQFFLQLTKVIDLAVERQDEAAVGGYKRLVGLRRQIHDREPAMPQCDEAVGGRPTAAVIGAAMLQPVSHAFDEIRIDR